MIDLIIEILRGKQIGKGCQSLPAKGVTGKYQIQEQYFQKNGGAMLRFTERQATAILEMRLYKLIGLEIEALPEGA